MPQPPKRKFLPGRLFSIRCALAGLHHLFRTQKNAQLHALATLAVLIAGYLAKLSPPEWLWIIAAIGAVLTVEALNTSLELLCDALHPAHHPLIGRAKDLAAAAVLLTALTAATLAAIIFLPHLQQCLER